MKQLLIAILLMICGASLSVKAQKTKSNLLKIVEAKPSIYISFDRSGKQEAIFEGESDQRIWLRLHNNTKLKIFLCEFSVEKEYGDIGIFYNVERVYFFQEYRNIKTPTGYGNGDTCDVFSLNSGGSALFSIPSEHLSKGLAIRAQFYYGWTGNWKEDMYEGTTHFVGFGNDELPAQEKFK